MTTKLPRDLEKTVQRSIARGLHALGFVVFRRNVGGLYDKDGNYVPFAEKGQSDLYGMLPKSHHSRHFELEVKREGEKPTRDQMEWLKRMSAQGAVAYWADNMRDAMRVADAVLNGGEIIWTEGCDFYVEMP